MILHQPDDVISGAILDHLADTGLAIKPAQCPLQRCRQANSRSKVDGPVQGIPRFGLGILLYEFRKVLAFQRPLQRSFRDDLRCHLSTCGAIDEHMLEREFLLGSVVLLARLITLFREHEIVLVRLQNPLLLQDGVGFGRHAIQLGSVIRHIDRQTALLCLLCKLRREQDGIDEAGYPPRLIEVTLTDAFRHAGNLLVHHADSQDNPAPLGHHIVFLQLPFLRHQDDWTCQRQNQESSKNKSRHRISIP